MITYFQAIILGLLQGISELFPVSSLGHSVILPQLVGWHIQQNDPFFLTFLVAVHLATSIVLIGFFWNDWLKIIKGMWISLKARHISNDNVSGKVGWLLVMGTIPAGILGLLLEQSLKAAFASPRSAAFFLILNGFLLYGAEKLRQRKVGTPKEDTDKAISQLSWGKALGVGAAQALALIPGFSRSGATMGGGLLVGLDNEESARFAFLLATPIIAGAALLKLGDYFTPAAHDIIGQSIVAALCAALAAYLSIRFLVTYFHTNRLTPFAIYCVVAGITFLTVLSR